MKTILNCGLSVIIMTAGMLVSGCTHEVAGEVTDETVENEPYPPAETSPQELDSPLTPVSNPVIPLCIDNDGDGYGADCDAGEDCNDTDPTINSGMIELPDDGKDNDCSGDGDLSRSNDSGIFVSAAGGNDLNRGTMDEPVASIKRAIELSSSGQKSIFIAGGVYHENISTPASLHGGYESGNWTRDIGNNITEITGVIDPDNQGFFTVAHLYGYHDIAITGITFTDVDSPGEENSRFAVVSLAVSENSWLVDNIIIGANHQGAESSMGIMSNSGRAHIFGNYIKSGSATQTVGVAISGGNTEARLADNFIHGGSSEFLTFGLVVANSATACLTKSIIDAGESDSGTAAIFLDAGGELLLYNNFLFGGISQLSEGLSVYGEESVAYAYHNTIDAGNGTTYTFGLDFGDSTGVIVNNIVDGGGGSFMSFAVFTGSASMTIVNNALSNSSMGNLMLDNDNSLPDIELCTCKDNCAEVCNCPSCREFDNLFGRSTFIDRDELDFHLSHSSVAVGSAIDPSLYGYKVESDIDGDRRPTGDGRDVGADEIGE